MTFVTSLVWTIKKHVFCHQYRNFGQSFVLVFVILPKDNVCNMGAFDTKTFGCALSISHSVMGIDI